MVKYIKLEDALSIFNDSFTDEYKPSYLKKYFNLLPSIELEDNQYEFVWNPYHKNNMVSNGLDGYYCLINDGKNNVKRFTVIFEYPEFETGKGVLDKSAECRFLLFVKEYEEIIGDVAYPAPSETLEIDYDFTLNPLEINDFGKYIHSYVTMEYVEERIHTELSKYTQEIIEEEIETVPEMA